MNKKVNKFTKVLLLIAVIFSDLMTPIRVFADEITDVLPNKGDIGINGVVSGNGDSTTVSAGAVRNEDGSLANEGDVSVTKTVSKAKDDSGNIIEGRYNIEFNIKGKDVVNSIETTKPVYVVVVFDRSGSMQNYCIGNVLGTEKEMGTEENCGMLGSLYTLYPKWKNSVLGAKSFANTLLSKIPDAQIALVTFATDTNATPAREFSNTNLDNANFGEPNGGTNLHSGLDKASQLLSSNSIPDNANKYIVVISDGQPTYYLTDNNEVDGPGGSTSKAVLDATYTEANDIKNNKGIEMFTIGYDLPSGTVYSDNTYGSLTAEDILEDVASVDTTEDIEKGITHYLEANPDAVATAFTNIATSISRFEAGTDATLTDNIGSNFKIVGQEGNVFTSTISKITEEGTTISFEIELDDSKITEAGWYDTNAGFSLVYTDATGTSKTITGNSNPQVYWTPSVYNYTVNYYKDSFNTDAIKSDTREATNGTVINLSNIEKDKYLNNSELGTVGYEFNSISPETITIDSNGKTINVLYTIKKFNYTVEFYYDGVLESESTIKKSDINYGTVVDSTTYYDDGVREGYGLDTTKSTSGNVAIDNDNIVIKVYYKKNIYNYTVNYIFNNNIDTDFTKNGNALFGSIIKTQDNYLDEGNLTSKETEDNTKYFIDESKNSEITIGTGDNILNVYYVSTIVTDEKIEKIADKNEITSVDDAITYTVTYTSVINNIKNGDKVKVVVTDTLPLEIYTEEENENTNLNGGEYNADSKTITWTFETTMNEFVKEYDASKTIRYTVVYKNVGNAGKGTLTNSVIGNTAAGGRTTTGKVATSDVGVNVLGTVTAMYVDENDVEIADRVISEGLIGKTFTTSAKSIIGYTLKDKPTDENVLYTKDGNTVKYVYSKNYGTSSEELIKVGPKEVSGINSPFEYKISYNTIIKDYVGNATLVIIDELPYEIDTEKSIYNGNVCRYLEGRLVCIYTKNVTEEDNEFDIEENFTLYYVDVKDNMVINKVTSTLTYGVTTKENDSECTSEIKEGTVTINYITKDGTKLTESIILTGMVGEEYTTNKKVFDRYSFIEVRGETEGKYTDDTIEVTYVYDLTPLPPQTGVDMNLFMFIKYLVFAAIIVVSDKAYKLINNN